MSRPISKQAPCCCHDCCPHFRCETGIGEICFCVDGIEQCDEFQPGIAFPPCEPNPACNIFYLGGQNGITTFCEGVRCEWALVGTLYCPPDHSGRACDYRLCVDASVSGDCADDYEEIVADFPITAIDLDTGDWWVENMNLNLPECGTIQWVRGNVCAGGSAPGPAPSGFPPNCPY